MKFAFSLKFSSIHYRCKRQRKLLIIDRGDNPSSHHLKWLMIHTLIPLQKHPHFAQTPCSPFLFLNFYYKIISCPWQNSKSLFLGCHLSVRIIIGCYVDRRCL